MTTFSTAVGGPGPTPDRPGMKYGGDQSWRQPEPRTPSGIDWEKDEKYFTPQPAKKKVYGRNVEEDYDVVPQTPVKKIRVKAIPPASYQNPDSSERDYISAVDWTELPASPSLMYAIKRGDIEVHPEDVRPQPARAAAQRPRPQPRPTPPAE